MKKQIFKFTSIILLLISIIFVWSNCQKSDSSVPVVTYGDIDAAGKLHNEGLDFVAQRLNFRDATNERIFDATKDFMLSKNPDWVNRKDFMDSKASTKLDFISSRGSIEPEEVTQIIMDFCKDRNSIEQGYMLQIAKTIEKLSETFDATPDFVKIQQNILADTRKNIDKKLLLGAASIAKYSAFFWKQASSDNKSAWYPILQQRTFSRTSWGLSLTTAKDLNGFFANYGSLMETYGGTARGEQYAWDLSVQGGIYESSR